MCETEGMLRKIQALCIITCLMLDVELGKAPYDRKAWGVQQSSFKSISQSYKGRERAVLENEAAEVKYAALKKRGYYVYWQEEIYLNKCVRK